MRLLVPLALLSACSVDYPDDSGPTGDRPSWVEYDWEQPSEGAWYFRTRGEIGPAVDDEGDGEGTDSVDGGVSGTEQWIIEDEDGVPACTVTWRTDGASVGQGDCPGCTEAWGVLCHDGELDPGCDQFFDPSYVQMTADLDLGFAEIGDGWGEVYMREEGSLDGWGYVAEGRWEGDRLIYDQRYRW